MSFTIQSMTTLFIIIHLRKRVLSEDSPIVPRGELLFEVKNWTGLLKSEYGNETVVFSKSAKLYELRDDNEKRLIGEVDKKGKLYNDKKDVSLCQRRVFQIEVKGGGESDPIIWTPRSYPNVRYSKMQTTFLT